MHPENVLRIVWAEGNQQSGGICPGPDSTLNASHEAFAPEGATLVIIPTLQMRTLTPGEVREIALSWDVAPQHLNTGNLLPEPVPHAGCQAASPVDEPGGPRARRRPRPPAELTPSPCPGHAQRCTSRAHRIYLPRGWTQKSAATWSQGSNDPWPAAAGLPCASPTCWRDSPSPGFTQFLDKSRRCIMYSDTIRPGSWVSGTVVFLRDQHTATKLMGSQSLGCSSQPG